MKQVNSNQLFFLQRFNRHLLFVILTLILTFISNEIKAQTPCNPPIAVNAGVDVSISCGLTANLGEVPTPPNNDPIAPSCVTPSQLTQGGGVYLNKVTTTGGINGNNINNLNTLINGIDPMGPNAWQSVWYSNYTSQIVESTAGGNFQLSLTAKSINNNQPYSVRIWIDWNNDGTFDNTPGSELVHTSTLINSNPFSFNNIVINVPTGQQGGTFRMRIRSKDNSPFVPSDNACTYQNTQGIIAPYAGYTGSQTGNYWFSDEIEDYGVKITGSGSNTGGGTFTYAWTPTTDLDDPTIPNPIASPEETTVYIVTVTDIANNCFSTDEVTVTVTNTTPTFTNPGPICQGETLTLPTSSDAGITGTWSPVANNQTTTTYTFTPDAGQCSTTAEMTVVVNSDVEPTFTNPGPICSGTAYVLPTTSNNGVTGTWSPAINNTATTTYTFTPDNTGCASTITLTVEVNSNVLPSFTNPGPICSGTAFTLPTTSNNGIVGTWSPAINNTITTIYSFAPNNTGCALNTTLTVEVNSELIPTFTNPGPVCAGTTFTLPTTSNNGVVGTWSPAINNTATTTYTFTPNNLTCVSTTTLTVVIDNPIVPTFTNPGPVCPNTPYSLSFISDNGISGTWSPANNTITTTTYTFTPTNGACASSATLTVVVNPNFEITLSGGGDICQGEEISPILITAVGGSAPYTFTYSVNNGSPITITSNQNTATLNLASYPGFSANNPNCYDITIGGNSVGACLTDDVTFTDFVCIHPNPIASFDINASSGGIFSMSNTSVGASNYLWNYGDGSGTSQNENPTHQYPSDISTNYVVQLIAFSEEGCSDTTDRIITVEEELIFYVPNTFTPDGDEYNNVFKPVMTSGFNPFNYRLEIYNRWGETLFVSNDIDAGWDGSYNGGITQDDMFVWKITFNLAQNDGKKTYTGHVTIIR